jgi:hypothetical protein
MDALRVFPDHADRIKTTQGVAYLQKKDIFKNLMWYSFEKSNTLYPLSIERVKEIIELNKKNVFPDELQAVEVVKKTAIAEKTDFVDVVGQFSLKSLERAGKKKKQKEKEKRATQTPGGDINKDTAPKTPGNHQNPNKQGFKGPQKNQKPQTKTESKIRTETSTQTETKKQPQTGAKRQ